MFVIEVRFDPPGGARTDFPGSDRVPSRSAVVQLRLLVEMELDLPRSSKPFVAGPPLLPVSGWGCFISDRVRAVDAYGRDGTRPSQAEAHTGFRAVHPWDWPSSTSADGGAVEMAGRDGTRPSQEQQSLRSGAAAPTCFWLGVFYLGQGACC